MPLIPPAVRNIFCNNIIIYAIYVQYRVITIILISKIIAYKIYADFFLFNHIPKSSIGDVKMTSRMWCPSLVTKGKSPPYGPAGPEVGLLHTFSNQI